MVTLLKISDLQLLDSYIRWHTKSPIPIPLYAAHVVQKSQALKCTSYKMEHQTRKCLDTLPQCIIGRSALKKIERWDLDMMSAFHCFPAMPNYVIINYSALNKRCIQLNNSHFLSTKIYMYHELWQSTHNIYHIWTTFRTYPRPQKTI